MMKKVVWSPRAEIDLYDILTYWIYHNKSATFSIKLELEIQEAIDAICLNPEIGKRTNRENIRLKLVRDF